MGAEIPRRHRVSSWSGYFRPNAASKAGKESLSSPAMIDEGVQLVYRFALNANAVARPLAVAKELGEFRLRTIVLRPAVIESWAR